MAQGPHDDHGGLVVDLPRLLGRRRVLVMMGGAGLAALAGCSSGDDTTAAGSATAAPSTSSGAGTTAAGAAGTTAAGACSVIPDETAGPFPGDGSNGPNALAESGVVRTDIRSSFGSSSGVAEGVGLTMEFTVVDTGAGCAPLHGAAVYAWHCDREGRYSLYSDGVTGENYLRGVQVSGTDGVVAFTTVFPGCYPGRWPHVHFEVYRSIDDATGGASPVATSQLAFPRDACDMAYAEAGYEDSVGNLAPLSLEADGIFADGVDQQLAAMSGGVAGGFVATLTIPV